MKAHFSIHGLPFELETGEPAAFSLFSEELRVFRLKKKSFSRRKVRLTVSAPPRPEGALRQSTPQEETFLYSKDYLLVRNRYAQRHIQVVARPDFFLQSDPAYHYCFTQPASLWLKQRGLFFLHAGCVAEGAAGILLIGRSRAGKSTLTLSAVRAGFHYLSDEQPLLSAQNGSVEALAFPRRIRLDPTTARLFPELRRISRSLKADRLIFPMEKIWPNSLALSCRPKVLIFPTFQSRGPRRLSPIPSSAALEQLLEDDHLLCYRDAPRRRFSHRHLELLKRLARQAPAYRLEYSTRDILPLPDLFRKLLRD